MRVAPDFPIRVFYDGSCSVCALEVERYGRMDHDGRLIIVDISDAAFDPAPYGITLAEFMYQMHVIDRSGAVFRGIEAFWAIWQAFPSSTLLGVCGGMIALPVINSAARLAYRLFARVRRFLPKRRTTCVTGSCRIDKKES